VSSLVLSYMSKKFAANELLLNLAQKIITTFIRTNLSCCALSSPVGCKRKCTEGTISRKFLGLWAYNWLITCMKHIDYDYHIGNSTDFLFLFLKALLLVLKDQFGILHCEIHHMTWLMQHSGALPVTYRTLLTSFMLVMLVSNGSSCFAYTAPIYVTLRVLSVYLV
jgi:hypothetical protein